MQDKLAVFTHAAGAVTEGVDETVYPVIEDPPLKAGAVQLTVTCALPGEPVTPVGDADVVDGGVGDCENDEEPAVRARFSPFPVRSVIEDPVPSLKS